MADPRRLSFPPSMQPTCSVCTHETEPSVRAAAAPLEGAPPPAPADFTFCQQCLASVHRECSATVGSKSPLGWVCATCSERAPPPPPPAPPAATTSSADPTHETAAAPAAPASIATAAIAAAPVIIETIDDDVVMIDAPVELPGGSELLDGRVVYEVERILSQRVADGKKQYRVKWKNFSEKDSTWEPEENVEACVEIIAAFKEEQAAKRAARRLNGGGGGSGASSVRGSGGGSGAGAKARRDAATASSGVVRSLAGAFADDGDWVMTDISAGPADLPAAAAASLASFLEFVQHNFTSETWDQLPLQSDAGLAEANGIAGSNVDFTALHTALHSCLHGKVDVPSLASVETFQHLLTEVLVKCMEAASRVRLIETTVVTLSKADGVLLHKAVLACTLALQLLSMPNVPRPLIREEYLNCIVRFLLVIIRGFLLPLYDQTARDKLLHSTGHAPGAQPDVTIDWRRLEAQLRFLVHKTSTIVERVTQLLAVEKVPDLLTTQLLDASYALFSVTPVAASGVESSFLHSLQSSASHLVQKVFLLGDAHTRKHILDSIVTTYRDLNPTRRHLRSYVVHPGHGVKKEGGPTTIVGGTVAVSATPAGSSNEELSSAIGSSIPLPSASLVATEFASPVSIQLLTALVCHLLQSIATEPLRTDRSRDSSSLLDRIKAEITAKEMAQSAAAAEAAEKKKAPTSGSKKKSKKAQQEEDDAADVTPTAGDIESSLATAGLTAFNTVLDTPQVRSEFIEKVTAPVFRVNDYLNHFLRTLIDRIQPPLTANSASSMTSKLSRQLLRNWLEDLLQVLFTPEFPVAEQMLTALVAVMLNIIDSKAVAAISDRFKMSCVSALALVSIHLKRHGALAAENPMVIRPKKQLVPSDGNVFGVLNSTHEEENVSSSVEEMHCVCGFRRVWEGPEAMAEASDTGFIIDCDECHVWYHGPCVGVMDDSATPANWHCENCVIRMECARQTAELMRKREKVFALASAAASAAAGSGKKTKKKGKPSLDLTAASTSVTSALAELESALPSLDASESAKVGSSVLRQLLINYLDARVGKSEEEALLYARQYDLCAWMQLAKVADGEAKKAAVAANPSAAATSAISPSFERDLELVQINFEPPRSAASSAIVTASVIAAPTAIVTSWVTREMGMRISRQLSAERPTGLLHLHNRILISLCARAKDSSPKFRSTAVSAIADLVRVDPVILKEPRIKATLVQRLADTSISTREAVVDLIGTHILQAQTELNAALQTKFEPQVKLEPNSAASASVSASAAAATAAVSSKYSLDPDYFRYVLSSLGDSGISVRKKVVRILRDLCLQARPHPRVTDMCEKLIACVRDSEESMQSLSVTIIYEMWFDRTNHAIRDRALPQKLVKDEPVQYEQESSWISATSPFTPQFQQQVQLIVGVIQRLSGTSGGVTSIVDGVDALTDILLLLLEQETSLSKAAGAAGGEMTSLNGLKMNLLKLSREQRKRQQGRATSAAPQSALMQSFNAADKPTKRRTPSVSLADDSMSIRRVCEDIVSVVVDLLVSSGSEPVSATPAADATALPPVTRLSCIQTLAVFSQVEPSFFLPHMLTLLPYLSIMSPKPPVDPKLALAAGKTSAQIQAEAAATKLAVANDTSCVLLLLEIFREVLYFIDSPAASLLSRDLAAKLQQLRADRTFALRLLNDLTLILTKSFQPLLIKASVPTLAILCERLTRTDMCVKTAKSFVGWLWAHQASARQLNANSIRALIGVGLLVKHWDLEAHYIAINAQVAAPAERTSFWQEVHKHCVDSFPAFKTNADLFRKSAWMLETNKSKQQNIIDPIFNLYKYYLRALSTTAPPATSSAAAPAAQAKPDGGKQAYVLQGIIAMFSRKPTLIPVSKEVIDICLSPQASTDLQRQALRFLREFLQHEDRRVQRTQREDRVREKTKKKGTKKKGAAAAAESEEEEDEEDEEMTDEHSVRSDASPASGKKSWVDSTIDASDFLPPMVSMCEKYVYGLAVSAHPVVRAEALQFMHVFLNQAVTNPIDAMPSLIAALTDRQTVPQRHAISIVTGLIAHKKEYLRFMEQRFADGIRLSFEMQSRLLDKVTTNHNTHDRSQTFDPLHRTNLSRLPSDEPIFDRTPMEGLASAYGLIKKTVAARKQFCKMIALDLLSVNQIGVFARQAEEDEAASDAAARGLVTPTASPIKPLEPHPSLNGRSLSTSSVGAASPLPSTPTGSQSEEFPAFVAPELERAVTPRLAPLSMQQAMASPSSYSAISEAPTTTQRPANPLAFLAYVAGLCTALPFEDDEPLQLCAHLSKVINTHGASLQAQMQQTIVTLKKLNGETVTENDEEEAAIEMAQPLETGGTQFTTASSPPQDKASLLASLKLQCESAMAITILIQLRQWLQKSYELAGLFDSWNLNASSSSAANTDSTASGSSRGAALKLTKKLDLPLHFNALPLEAEQAEQTLSAHSKGIGPALVSVRQVAGKSAVKPHSRHASVPNLPSHAAPVSIIPSLCSAQFAHFHACMERETLFLAMKAPKRGHKRAATTGGLPNEESPAKKTRKPAAKKKATKKKRKSFSSESEASEEEDDDEFEDESPRKRTGAAGSRAKGGRAKKKSKLAAVAEEDEEEEEPQEEEEEEEEE